MQKVITINLNGNAYQFDEDAYTLLREYLERAEQQLKDNPDRAEIISDLEQAIADKCSRVLGQQKTVVSGAEIRTIVDEMGPVDGASDAGTTGAGSSAHSGRTARPDAPRRLYQISEGAMLSGVCVGLGAYFHVDVTIIRILFVLATLATGGLGIIAYIVMMIVVPHATTSEEQAAAFGLPFNAQELIDRAKRKYSDFKGDREHRREARRRHREWRRHIRPMTGRNWGPRPPRPLGYAGQLFAGVMLPILTIARVGLFWIWVCVLASLFSTNAVFGEPIPEELPFWTVILVAVVAYIAVSWPLHAAKRATYYALGTHDFGWIAAWDGLLGLGLTVLGLWLAFNFVPEVHDFLDHMDIVRANIQNLLRGV